MKKLFIVAAALTALAVAAPTVGLAQHDYDNQYGIFADIAGEVPNIITPPSTPVTAYLLLLQPVDNYGAPVDNVEAFECQITFSNGAMVFKLGEVLPPQAINVGDSSQPANGLDYAVGLGTPLPVTAEAATLITFTFMVLTPDPISINIIPSTTGNMYYQEALNKELVDAFPTSGDVGLPVASFNGGVVATESETWGGVKSLYR